MIRLDKKNLSLLGIKAPKQNKYHAKKTVIDGITFDSKKESNKYAELLLMKKAHIITEIELQPEFILQPWYTDKQGKNIRPIKYRADFKITYTDGTEIVIDIKGGNATKTAVYKLKKKMLLYRYPNLEFVEE